jgi:putative endonuclease
MPKAGKFARLWIDAQEWAARRMDRWPKRSAMAPHLVTGLHGERAVLFELGRRGMVVVARRWTSPKVRGDLDLVGWDGDCLCFVEVKTRSARDMNPPEAEVDEHKRRMVRGLARAYLRAFPEQDRKAIPVRFDVVSVYLLEQAAEFEFFEGAFGWR